MATGVDALHGLFDHLLKYHYIKGLIWFQHIHQMMGHTVHLLRTDLGRADVHMAVNLHGICGNDLSVHHMGQCNG